MPPYDFLADPRMGRLPIDKLKKHLVGSNLFPAADLEQATTKFALVSLAESKGMDLEVLLKDIVPTPASSQRRRGPQTPKAKARRGRSHAAHGAGGSCRGCEG